MHVAPARRPSAPHHPVRLAVALTVLATACAPAGPSTAGTPAPATGSAAASQSPHVQASTPVAAGEYLAIVGGCHDCHTPGWAEQNGRVPPAGQFVGSPVGYRGPWGTTYAANLRLVAQRASEDRWVEILTTADGGHGRPPMPWMNTEQMNEQDLRAIYRYIHGLGAAGQPAPRTVPPGEEPQGPFIWMVPQQPGAAPR